jgi:hypothetical protein
MVLAGNMRHTKEHHEFIPISSVTDVIILFMQRKEFENKKVIYATLSSSLNVVLAVGSNTRYPGYLNIWQLLTCLPKLASLQSGFSISETIRVSRPT